MAARLGVGSQARAKALSKWSVIVTHTLDKRGAGIFSKCGSFGLLVTFSRPDFKKYLGQVILKLLRRRFRTQSRGRNPSLRFVLGGTFHGDG